MPKLYGIVHNNRIARKWSETSSSEGAGNTLLKNGVGDIATHNYGRSDTAVVANGQHGVDSTCGHFI